LRGQATIGGAIGEYWRIAMIVGHLDVAASSLFPLSSSPQHGLDLYHETILAIPGTCVFRLWLACNFRGASE
jgi:hypothetical protein